MISVTYSGYYRVFILTENKTITKIYDHSLQDILPNGIYCAEMDSSKKYLLIGSFASSNSYNYKKTSNGISIFRVLNTEPWIKHVEVDKSEKTKQKELTSLNKNSSKMNYSKIVKCFIFFDTMWTLI